jgi:superfamily II DNA or RNA helicase
MLTSSMPQVGDFVETRGRRWLVEGRRTLPEGLETISLSCLDDDAQGEAVEVAWSSEIEARALAVDDPSTLAQHGTDDPAIFSAYLRTLRWSTATAADRDLLQAPFRAGIRLDAYQLLPLRKALRLARVNLLIADDVGLGKTVEAGLILREMLLRRRLDFTLVVAPAGMVQQWRDELQAKFGLAFTVVDREHLDVLRRTRGWSVNPWATGSRFILSHSLLADETYAAGLRDVLGAFRGRSLLILDEAHHAAPSAGSRYAVDSQFTRAVRDVASRFEHRLFLSATPHNGHSNSFSALLEMLDPQRFTRGIDVLPRDLEPVMVRRLKSDLRSLGERFPERIVEPIPLTNLPANAPELLLATMLAAYGDVRQARLARLPRREQALGALAFVGLQQRLLSSIAAFAGTLRKHRESLARQIEADDQFPEAGDMVAEMLIGPEAAVESADGGDSEDENRSSHLLAAQQDEAAVAATRVGIRGATIAELRGELAQADAMLTIAERHAREPDARLRWLVEWIRTNLLTPSGQWNTRRLVLFTEYEDTRRWIERRLLEAFGDTAVDGRIAAFTGVTSSDRREELKRAFNADPQIEPLRILVCTDAAREGINLQSRCHDLIHIDLPWNPARLEQRNGRIDRKLQPSDQVWCRYFVYTQREEDVVLSALVRKTERIREQLGSAGQVIGERIAQRIGQGGIRRGRARLLAEELENEGENDSRLDIARRELDDEQTRRLARLRVERDELWDALEKSRERVGVAPDELRDVVGTALARAGVDLMESRAGHTGPVDLFRLDPDAPVFRAPGWADAFDDLRERPARRGERPSAWRSEAAVRKVSFEPAIVPEDGTDMAGVVQLHLEHRLVRRLLSRFLSQGFQSGLERVCVITGPGSQPRIILLGRLLLYGAGAARLHEEIIPVTARWIEATRGTVPLAPFKEEGEERTLAQLDGALRDPRRPPPGAVARAGQYAAQDARDLMPELSRRATEREAEVRQELAKRGEEQSEALRMLLDDLRRRLEARDRQPDDAQLQLDFAPEEREQARQERRHRAHRLSELDEEIRREPNRVREGYEVRASRLELVGLVTLWPATN